ncbi:MAG: hypothetical protein OXG24_11310 [Gammaproteobacteria bacterium]|nr:hypothetical protein [Gammaproteobacteria bacterium]
MAQPEPCRWICLREAIANFASGEHPTQSGRHIKPLHWHIACRLVLEGGFHPDDVTPRPPFAVKSTKTGVLLIYDETLGDGSERTLLGGLKTKNVDVVVTRNGIGPVIAVSMKGTLNAFRNLTNRMEEAVGDCTNLHIAYPALVYGFLHILRANEEGDNVESNDVFVLKEGTISENISRYHDVMVRLTGRSDIRDDVSRYEAVALLAAETNQDELGTTSEIYPLPGSPLHFSKFMNTIYTKYDERFVYAAPVLKRKTQRLEWDVKSPAFSSLGPDDYSFRTN